MKTKEKKCLESFDKDETSNLKISGGGIAFIPFLEETKGTTYHDGVANDCQGDGVEFVERQVET